MDQPKYSERNSVVLGVSGDSVDSHKDFCTRQGLNFRLLSDRNHRVMDSYGSMTNLGVVKFAARHTFIIDPQGRIAKAFTSVNPATASDQVLTELDQLHKSTSAK